MIINKLSLIYIFFKDRPIIIKTFRYKMDARTRQEKGYTVAPPLRALLLEFMCVYKDFYMGMNNSGPRRNGKSTH